MFAFPPMSYHPDGEDLPFGTPVTWHGCGAPRNSNLKWGVQYDERKSGKRGAMNPLKVPSGAIEDAIVTLLREREGVKTICPSEVARRLAPEEWEPLMHPVREVAARLAIEGRLVATQKGKEVNALSAHGPIRLKATRSLLEGGSN